jgi:hypothetical protein
MLINNLRWFGLSHDHNAGDEAAPDKKSLRLLHPELIEGVLV